MLRGATTHRGRCPFCGSPRFRLSRGSYAGFLPDLLGLIACRCLSCDRHFPALGRPAQAAPVEAGEETAGPERR